MYKILLATLVMGVGVACEIGGVRAQDTPQPPYLNPTLSPEARAIPRLGVPAYDWWSEALHGVATKGTTEFPEPVGLAGAFACAVAAVRCKRYHASGSGTTLELDSSGPI